MKKLFVLVVGCCWILTMAGCGGQEVCRGGECYQNLYGALGDDNPCSGVDCSGHGTCFFQEDDAPFCLCQEGYASYGTECSLIPDGARDYARDDCIDGQIMVDLALVELGRDDTEVGVDVDVYPYALNNYVGGEAWCSEFVSWLYVYAGDPFTGGSYGGWMLTDSYAIRSWFQNAPVDEWIDSDDPDYAEFDPQPGDYIRWDNSSGGHSNIVHYVDGTTLYTVDGNWGDLVVAREIPNYLNNSGLDGFGHRVCPNQAPTVSAGDDQIKIFGELVQLSGTAEDDGEPLGTLTVSWSKFDGPGDVTFGDVSNAQTSASFSESGLYTLRLTADDGLAQTYDDVIIELGANEFPLVDAGADQSVVLPREVALQGSASDDGVPAGGLLVVAWSLVDGPGQVVFDDSSAPQTIASFTTAGMYTLRLSAADGLLLGSDEVVIEVLENQVPQVDAGSDMTVLLPASAELAGVVLDDGLPDDLLTIAWSKVSGPGEVLFENAGLPATSAGFTSTGSYLLRLTADDGMAQVSDEVTVVVIRNYPPSVDAGPDQLIEFPGTVNLSGAVSDDGWPNGVLEIEWSVTGDPPGEVTFDDVNSPATAATFSQPGSYTLQLTAGDGELVTSDQVVVSLQANQAPVVDAGPDRNVPLNTATLLTGLVEDDGLPDGTLTIAWSQLDGPTTVVFDDASVAATLATFPELGAYTLRLSASDGVLQSEDDVVITVVADDNLPPLVDAGPNQIVKLGDGAQLSGSASDDGLPDGILTTTLSLVEGPGQVEFADLNALQTTVTFGPAGFYTLRLTASDGVLEAHDQVIITVEKKYPTGEEEPTAAGCNCHTGRTGYGVPWAFIALLLCAIFRSRGRTI